MWIKQIPTAESHSQRKRIFQKTGCKGSCALRTLEGHELFINTPIDPMHLIKNITSHCINLITGLEDSCKVCAEEKFRQRFSTSWITNTAEGKLPVAPFSLSHEDISLADDRAKRVLVPHDFDWHPSAVFSRTTGLKSHEWKQLAACGILILSPWNAWKESKKYTFQVI